MNLDVEYLLHLCSIISFTFWIVICIMHVCALVNAKLKLNRRSYTSAASKRKRKTVQVLQRTNEELMFQNDTTTSPRGCIVDGGSQHSLEAQDKTITDNRPKQQTSEAKLTSNINEASDIEDRGCTFNQETSTHAYISLPLPGVSIIKPLMGVDANLSQNLETFFNQDYPIYELLFCVQEPDDAAILVVKDLFKLYPYVDAKLFIGGSIVGVNPKINNMQPAYEAAKYGLILVSDSGISMKRDTLLDMVAHMGDEIALVHQMPFVCERRTGFHSVVERVFFGTSHARAYLTADLLRINCASGMSALMRKDLLDEVGGIKAFGKYLAEDYFFAKSFVDRGWKICISSQPAWQNSSDSSDSLQTLNTRIERWIKLRFAMVPQWTIFEPFSECMVLGVAVSMSLNFLWSVEPLATFLFHVLLWFLSDYQLLCIIQGGSLTFSKTDFVVAWLLRESTALYVFLKALANQRVVWRSRVFRLRWGGFAEEISINGGGIKFVPTTKSAQPATVHQQAITVIPSSVVNLDHEMVSVAFRRHSDQQEFNVLFRAKETSCANEYLKYNQVSSQLMTDVADEAELQSKLDIILTRESHVGQHKNLQMLELH